MRDPREDLELDNIRAVPVVFDARDDIGLSQVAIHIALAGDEDNSEVTIQDGYTGRKALGQRRKIDTSSRLKQVTVFQFG